MSSKLESKPKRKFTFKRIVIALGALIVLVLEASPDIALQAWLYLPAEIKETLPPRFAPAFGVLLVVLANIRGIIGAIKRKGTRNET